MMQAVASASIISPRDNNLEFACGFPIRVVCLDKIHPDDDSGGYSFRTGGQFTGYFRDGSIIDEDLTVSGMLMGMFRYGSYREEYQLFGIRGTMESMLQRENGSYISPDSILVFTWGVSKANLEVAKHLKSAITNEDLDRMRNSALLLVPRQLISS